MAYQPFRLFNAKTIPLEEHSWYYLTHSWEDNGVHTFPKGIWPKVIVIARLEYELAYYDSAYIYLYISLFCIYLEGYCKTGFRIK